MFRRNDLKAKFVRLLQKRIERPNPLRGPGPGRTLLKHLAKCGWTKIVTHNSLNVSHEDLGTMDFFASPDAQLKRWLSYTARQIIFEGLRARAEGETSGFPRKDAKGIPLLFVPDLEVNWLLLDGNVSEKLIEATPHIEEQLDPISYRRLEVIMTGAIRTQVRFNAAGIKTPLRTRIL